MLLSDFLDAGFGERVGVGAGLFFFYTENRLINVVDTSIFTECGTGVLISRISWAAAVWPMNFRGTSMVVRAGSMTRPSEMLSKPAMAMSSGTL